MTTEKVNIKESNYYCIKDFFTNQSRPEMQGNKLKALFKLIQKKGEPIQTEDKSLQGVKALKISDSEFIAIKKTPINGNFYPCMIKTYLLTSL